MRLLLCACVPEGSAAGVAASREGAQLHTNGSMQRWHQGRNANKFNEEMRSTFRYQRMKNLLCRNTTNSTQVVSSLWVTRPLSGWCASAAYMGFRFRCPLVPYISQGK